MATEDCCAVCYGSITDLDPATTGQPCKCSGSIKYHPFCYEDMCGIRRICPVCKTSINKSNIFDDNWVVNNYYYGAVYYTIDSEERKHGKYLLINRDTRKIVEQCNYIHGLKNGLYQTFDTEANVIHECFYKMGKLHGHYFGEKLILDRTYKYFMYYEDGLLNGPATISRNIKSWEKFYDIYAVSDTKKIFGKQLGHYKNGMTHGIFRIFDSDGSILESIEYKDGELDGIAIFYDFNGLGTIEQKIEFKKGLVCGKLTIYWPYTGTERFTCIIANDGMVRGPVYINDESGALQRKIICKKPTYLATVLPEDISIRKPNSSNDLCYVEKEYYTLRELHSVESNSDENNNANDYDDWYYYSGEKCCDDDDDLTDDERFRRY